MPQFLDQDYSGYKVSLRPRDPFRKLIRIKIPRKVDLFLLPYLWGTDISFNLTIKATKSTSPVILKYYWQLYKDENKDPIKNGIGTADMITRKKHNDTLDLGHFSHMHKYHLDLTIETSTNRSDSHTLVDFETSSRTAFQLLILASLFAIIGGFIGGVVVHFIG